MLTYGLGDDYHCIWWQHTEHYCQAGAFLIHPDYRELVRRLPTGAGDPGPTNTLQLGAGGGGGGRRRLRQQGGSSSGAAGPSLASILEAAREQEAHILFLSSAPDLSALDLPGGNGTDAQGEERYQTWRQNCHWMREMPKNARRRKLIERQQQQPNPTHEWLSSSRLHADSERWDL